MPQTLLTAHELVRTRGPRTVLSGVSLSIDDDARIALVGRNGSGKSTLLRLLAGAEAPDGGRVVSARAATVLYLPQLDDADDRAPVRAVLPEHLGVAAAAREMDRLAVRLSTDPGALAAHAAALEKWVTCGGADVDPRLDRAAATAGLDPRLLDRTPDRLSGGQRARAMLAAIGVARAEVLLLDEPANHLDADGLAQLRALLLARAGGLVLVAHDRALLAAVSTRVAALDGHDGTLTVHNGGWEAYEAQRDRARRQATQAHDAAVAERRRLKQLERAARARAARGHRSAQSENDRALRHLFEQSAERGSDGKAAQFARRAARVEVPDRPWADKPTHLTLSPAGTGGGTVIALEGVVLRRGSFVLGPVDLALSDGERLLLTGPNASGKSTLLAALAGRLRPEAGRARVVAAAEVAQARSSLLGGGERDLVAAVRAHAGIGEREARAALAAMGLDQELVVRSPASLSPGERTRAELAAATAAGARVLLLDEPTNHLDVEALQALESALEQWPGALVVATHDERLRAGLRLDQVLDVAAIRRRPG